MTDAPKDCRWLRVLATSDVHAHLRGFDYARDTAERAWGLTRVATRVAEARAEASATVLLDNGDLLQGTPLAQLFSASVASEPHPVLTAMEAMGYDAIGLGNHEFNYGLERLENMLSQTKIPVLCANVVTRKGASVAEDACLRPPGVILHRTLLDRHGGAPLDLRIGVLSVVPTQVMTWDGAHLKGRVETRTMVESATYHVARMRDEGADVVILLGHTGIDPEDGRPDAENAALSLARVSGVDAMITGHTHRRFPDLSVMGDGIDAQAGTICGVPTVMPGYRGSSLGVIDLCLERHDGRWSIRSHTAALRSVAGAAEDPEVTRVTQPAHRATLDYISQPLGHTTRSIHSYLGKIEDDLPTRIVAMAQKVQIEKRLSGTDLASLPLLSASAPYQTGGRSGPLAYVDIPAGPLTMRDANRLYPFPNTLCAVRATGAEVQDWLERAASAYRQIRAGEGDQQLLNPAFPGHAIDTLYGLSYRIDLSRPPAYDASGMRLLARNAPPRVVELYYGGARVQPEDWFLVAVSGYRAYGGGPYEAFGPERIVLQTNACALQSVATFMQSGGVDQVTSEACWRFRPVPGARVHVATGPGFARHSQDMTRLSAVATGETEDGFLQVSMPLDHTTCESAA